MKTSSVLFMCMHNSSRSQLAEGLLRADHGDRFTVYSAGIEPRGVNPLAVEAMREIGIDITGHRSQHVDDFEPASMDFVVTVCDRARDTCPYLPALKRNVHRKFSDPSAVRGTNAEKLAAFRDARDKIRTWLSEEFTKEAGS